MKKKNKKKVETCITCYVQFNLSCYENDYEKKKMDVISKLEKFGNVSVESEDSLLEENDE